MKFNFVNCLAVAGLSALIWAGSAKASPDEILSVEASTTGQAGSYSATLASAPASGSTLYYEVFVLAQSGATNANTPFKPTGTTDTVISLPNFTLTASADSTFQTSALQNNFGTGSGATAGTTGSNTLDVRAIELGYSENDDTLLGVVAGTLTVGPTFSGITASTDIPFGDNGTNAGSLKFGTHPVGVTQATETSSDPLLGYTALTESSSTPEPASLGLLGLGAVAMMRRRRTGTSAGAKA